MPMAERKVNSIYFDFVQDRHNLLSVPWWNSRQEEMFFEDSINQQQILGNSERAAEAFR